MDKDKVVEAIQEIIAVIRKECIIQNTAIRDGIFGILEKYCTVIYYPIENEKNRGFHIKKIVKDKLEDFVYINTAKPIDEQIFAAAHEFGHIWDVSKKVWEKIGYEGKPTQDEEEEITNLFAAELLMPEDIFKKAFMAHLVLELHVKPGIIKVEDMVRAMVLQMSDFMVPYEAVRRRLIETKMTTEESAEPLLSEKDNISEFIEIFSKDKNTYMKNGAGVKTISGIRNLIENAEKNENIDEYLLNKVKKDFDIKDMPIAEEKIKIHIGDTDNE